MTGAEIKKVLRHRKQFHLNWDRKKHPFYCPGPGQERWVFILSGVVIGTLDDNIGSDGWFVMYVRAMDAFGRRLTKEKLQKVAAAYQRLHPTRTVAVGNIMSDVRLWGFPEDHDPDKLEGLVD